LVLGPSRRVVPVARQMVNPWSLAFLPDSSILVTEKKGRLRIRARSLATSFRARKELLILQTDFVDQLSINDDALP
jgi:glucose/arabinose dehydrogenase